MQGFVEMSNLAIKIGELNLKNPVMVASGTFGYAQEYQGLLDLNKLGAVVTKSITLQPRAGNPLPRAVETVGGMLNSIGLEHPGLDIFITEKLPFLEALKIPVIVSIAGNNLSEFAILIRRLNKRKGVDALELNLSCPNVLSGARNKRLMAQDENSTYKIIKRIRQITKLTLIAKLTPNVTDIAEIARAAESAGADALSLVNTYYGAAVNINTRRSRLGSGHGGLSGPAIKPLALYAVQRVFKAVKLPLIGMGGIMDWPDALEFMIAGATAVAVGTANFVNPRAGIEIIKGLKQYLKQNKIKNLKTLIGSLKI
jgi:dihydroorotate dehydrogenase (NAD+) catalytic subunit